MSLSPEAAPSTGSQALGRGHLAVTGLQWTKGAVQSMTASHPAISTLVNQDFCRVGGLGEGGQHCSPQGRKTMRGGREMGAGWESVFAGLARSWV